MEALAIDGYDITTGTIITALPAAKELTITGYIALTAGEGIMPVKGIMEIDGYSPNILYNEYDSGVFWRRLPDTRLN